LETVTKTFPFISIPFKYLTFIFSLALFSLISGSLEIIPKMVIFWFEYFKKALFSAKKLATWKRKFPNKKIIKQAPKIITGFRGNEPSPRRRNKKQKIPRTKTTRITNPAIIAGLKKELIKIPARKEIQKYRKILEKDIFPTNYLPAMLLIALQAGEYLRIYE